MLKLPLSSSVEWTMNQNKNCMDNARYEIEQGEAAEMDLSAPEAAKIIEAIEGVRRGRFYKAFLHYFIRPRLERMQLKLEQEKDLIETYRAQGAIRELKMLLNLTSQEEALRNTIPHGEDNRTESSGESSGSSEEGSR